MGESDQANGALEALGVCEHVDVREDVGRFLVAAGEGDLGELFDRGVFITGLVTSWAREAVVGGLALGKALEQRVARAESLRFFGEVVRFFWIPSGARFEHDGFELLFNVLEEVLQRGAVGARAWKVGRGDEDGGLRGQLFGDFAQRLQRGLDHFSIAEPFLADLARAEQGELEAGRCFPPPAAYGSWAGHRQVSLLNFNEQIFFKIAGRGYRETSATNDHHAAATVTQPTRHRPYRAKKTTFSCGPRSDSSPGA